MVVSDIRFIKPPIKSVFGSCILKPTYSLSPIVSRVDLTFWDQFWISHRFCCFHVPLSSPSPSSTYNILLKTSCAKRSFVLLPWPTVALIITAVYNEQLHIRNQFATINTESHCAKISRTNFYCFLTSWSLLLIIKSVANEKTQLDWESSVNKLVTWRAKKSIKSFLLFSGLLLRLIKSQKGFFLIFNYPLNVTWYPRHLQTCYLHFFNGDIFFKPTNGRELFFLIMSSPSFKRSLSNNLF